jgi:hypothetical protein
LHVPEKFEDVEIIPGAFELRLRGGFGIAMGYCRMRFGRGRTKNDP